MNPMLFILMLFSAKRGQTSVKTGAALLGAAIIATGGYVAMDDGGLHDQSQLISNGCWNATYCEATFTINATASDKEIRKDIELIPTFEDKNRNKKNVTFTVDYEIYHLVPNNTVLENGTIIISDTRVDTGKQLKAGELNYIHYYTTNFNEQWVDWHLEIKGIPKEVLGIQKDVTFDTHKKGWAVWGGANETDWYPLDNSYTDTYLLRNMTGYSTSFTTASKVGSHAANLTGTAYMTSPSILYSGANNFSIHMWVYPTSFTGTPFLFHMSGTSGTWDTYSYINAGGTLYVNLGRDGTQSAGTTTKTLTVNQWNQIVYVFRNGQPSVVYINNQTPDTVFTGAFGTNMATPTGWGRHNGGSSYFQGRMDDVRVYKGYVLNASDVNILYNGSSGYNCRLGDPLCGGGSGGNTSISWTQNITGASLNHNTSWVTDLNVTNSTTCGVTGIYSNNTNFPIDQYTGIVSVPARTANWSYQHWIGFYAQDNCTDTADIWQNISITYTNNAPVNNWSANNYTRNHNTSWYSPSHCIDQDNDAITTTSNDSVVSFLSNGSLSFTSEIAKTGVYSLYINCTDGYASDADVSTFTVTNTAPTISCTNQSRRYYKNYTVCTGSDADGDALTFAENGTYYTANASGIHYTANYAAIGSYAIFANVTDSLLTSASVLTSQNITDISSSVVTLCNVSRIAFIPNTSLINYSTNYTTQSVLMNGTLINGCSFLMNTTSEEGPLRLFAKVNYTTSNYTVKWGSTNLTSSYQLIETVTNGTVVRYNVTGYWNNAFYKSFPLKISLNVTV